MSLTLDLTPQQESTLAALAATQGLTLEQAVIRAVVEASERLSSSSSTTGYQDLFSDPMKGLG